MNRFAIPAIRRGTVERGRLLDVVAQDDPLTLVHGTAGSGKSTVLAQYAHSISRDQASIVWISLNADDTGLERLATRILETTLRATSGDTDQTEIPTGIELVAAVRAALTRSDHETLYVFLDDYHHVADPAADDFLLSLLSNSRNLRVLVGTRVAGQLAHSEVAARIPVTLLEAEDLEFSQQDTAELLQLSGVADDPQLATAIHTSSRGWPLATHALVIEAQRGEFDAAEAPIVAHRRSRFLKNLVKTRLAQTSPDVRDFVFRTCLVDELTVELAERLTDLDAASAEEFFDRLERDGVGTWQFRDGEEVFRHHPLIREALERAAESHLGEREIHRLKTILADTVGQSRPALALELSLQLRDWDRMDALIRKQFPTMSANRREGMLAILEQVPASVAQDYPSILGSRTILEYGRPSTPATQLKRALSFVLGATSPSARDQLGDGALRMAASRLMGNGDKAIELTNVVIARVESATEEELDANALILPTVLTQCAITLIYDGQYDRALAVTTMARDYAVRAGLLREPLHALALTALAHALRGDMVSARAAVTDCEQHEAPAGWRDGYVGAGYRIARALDYLDKGDPESAIGELDVLAPHEPTIEHWPYLAVVDAWARLQRDGAEAAYAALRATLARKRWRLPPVESLRTFLSSVQADLLVAAGQPVRAQKTVASYRSEQKPELALSRARIALARGDSSMAFAVASETAWRTHVPRLRAEALLIKAVAGLHTDQPAIADEALRSALSVLDEYGLRLPLLRFPRSVLEEIRAAAGSTTAGSLVEGLPDAPTPLSIRGALSPAELRVLEALATTPHTTDISAALHLSTNTVRSHLKSINRKLGVNSRKSAVSVARELGLLTTLSVDDEE